VLRDARALLLEGSGCDRERSENVEQDSSRAITDSLRAKVFEAIERTEHLVAQVPLDRLNWAPEFSGAGAAPRDFGHLMGHLLDCLAGFCAVFAAGFPAELAELQELRSYPVNQFCSPEEARKGLRMFAGHIDRGFQCCTDGDLARRIATVFVPEGETVLTLLLGNFEHLTNHKYQLFLQLKFSGALVGTKDLYHLRGPAGELRSE
jgi:DinB superfamily